MNCTQTRIEKAIALIEQGKVYQQNDGVFRVLTDRFAGGYTVTPTSCECADFERRQATEDNSPCKHQWAAIGATAARLIHGVHQADSLSALESIGKAYAGTLTSLPQVFLNIARSEYRARKEVLTQATHDEEELAILIKPQPKSNGNYNGIEI